MINGHFASQVALWEHEARTRLQAEAEKRRDDIAKDDNRRYTATDSASNVSASQDRLSAMTEQLIRLVSRGN